MAGSVFQDGRLGCWIGNRANLASRAAGLRALGITDVLLRGPDGTPAAKADALALGFTAVLGYWSVDGLSSVDYAARLLADVGHWAPAAGDLNIELSDDAALEPYMRDVHARVRAKRPSYRLRFNIGARKGVFLPADLFARDPNLYACEGNYGGNMEELFSAADALDRLIAHGVPRERAAVCYAGACAVGGVTGTRRVNTFPLGWPPSRGVIFTDDLLAEAGLL